MNYQLEHKPIKESLELQNSDEYGRNWIEYKKASKQFMVDSVEGITKENIVKDIDTVKNAICFIKDDIFYSKHYDTIIFAFSLKSKKILELYGNCSQTSNRQLHYIRNWLIEKGFIDSQKFGGYRFNELATKHEPTTRGMKNKFWDPSYGGGF